MTMPEKQMLGLALLFTMLACGGGGGSPTPTEPTAPPLAVTVTTGSSPPPRFIPSTTTLAVGGTVTWRNGSPVNHTVISKTDAWPASPELAPAETFQVTFPAAGVFGYRCSLHPGMEGSITVR